MLDDLKYVHEKDSQDALGIAERQWQQLEYKFDLPDFDLKVENIVYAGMGGSALAALISQSWPSYSVPFKIVRDYSLPAYVSSNTLCIIASYSGNTEEAISCLEQAKIKGAKIVIIAGGGKLMEQAHQAGYPLAIIPRAGQPRFSVLYVLKALVTVLEKAKLVEEGSAEQQMHQAGQFLKQAVAQWLPTVPSSKNPAKQIAQELMGKSVVIYSGPLFYPAAYKWKISINENAKQIAWCNKYPEFNHNEMLGWTEQPVQKPYAVIDIRSNQENDRIQKRFEVAERLLSGSRPTPIIVRPQGSTLLEQLLWTVALGDFTCLYLALLNGLNPSPVDLIEKFKKMLNT